MSSDFSVPSLVAFDVAFADVVGSDNACACHVRPRIHAGAGPTSCWQSRGEHHDLESLANGLSKCFIITLVSFQLSLYLSTVYPFVPSRI